MFIYSVKAGTIKFVGIVCAALAALIVLIAFVPAYTGASDVVSARPAEGAGNRETLSIRFDKVKSAEDAAAFLGQFGWAVDAGSAECVGVTIPAEFDKIFAGYNQLQLAQGLDLSKYRRKDVTRYTFRVTNYEGWDGPVLANVLVYRGRVIGGDVCSADVTGFIHGFARAGE